MGQYWQIVNLTTMRSLGCMGKLGESLWGSQEDLVKRIARGPNDLPPPPIAASLAIAKESFSSQATTVSLFSSASGNLSAFNRLPAELVRMIFEEFATFVDAFVFGLTCSSVWNCGKPVIHRLYFRWFAPWSGQRLICVGDYASDLPDSLHDEGVLDELSQVLSAHRTRVREIHGGNAGSEGDDKDEEDDLTKWTKSKGAWNKSFRPISIYFPYVLINILTYLSHRGVSEIQRSQTETSPRRTHRVHRTRHLRRGLVGWGIPLLFLQATSRCQRNRWSEAMDRVLGELALWQAGWTLGMVP